MEIIYERVAAIDVGKKIIAVAVRTPGEGPGKRRQQVRKFNIGAVCRLGTRLWFSLAVRPRFTAAPRCAVG